MEIAEPIRFAAGIVFLAIGVAMLWKGRGTRGFSQPRQAGLVALAGGAVLIALGLGLFSLGGGLLT